MTTHITGETQGSCTATTRAGARCRGRALPGRETCAFHSEDRAAALAEARRAGGRASSREGRARKRLGGGASLAFAEERLAEAMAAVLAGRLEPAAASALAALARSVAVVRAEAREEARATTVERPVYPVSPPPPINYKDAQAALMQIIVDERGRLPEP